MRIAALSILLAAGAVLACPATAQEAPASPPLSPGPEYYPPITNQPADPGWSGDPRLPCCDVIETRRSRSFRHGVAALEANDFVQAEAIFVDIMRYNRNDTVLRFYMGLAKMNLGKWDEAKRYLKTAAREMRRLPDPKGHLGVTYVRLGDLAAANAQRTRLVQMAQACKGTCKLSSYILEGIEMIDKALAETPVPTLVPTLAPTSAPTPAS